jgi:murein DD-endopeptidase MepM/ murein hydrolase activator NlpD
MKMKKTSLVLMMFCLISAIVFMPPSNRGWLSEFALIWGINDVKPLSYDHQNSQNLSDSGEVFSQNRSFDQIPLFSELSNQEELPTVARDDTLFVNLGEIADRLGFQVKVDARDGTITIRHQSDTLSMVQGIPVLNCNGIFEPMEQAPVIQNGNALVPLSFMDRVLQQQVVVIGKTAEWQVNPASIPVFAPKRNLPKMSAREIARYLSFLRSPIRGAHVSTHDSHLPGAPRTYRHGVHEGLDWYTYGTGVTISKRTPVYSLADGVVVRADVDYQEMTPAERNRLLAVASQSDGQTPAYILDKMRGRQVWVQYGKGVMARFVHLSRIAPGIKAGQTIKAGQLIGYAGNSGTSDGVKGSDQGVHLHLDLLLYGEWFWDGYTVQERREILDKIFDK